MKTLDPEANTMQFLTRRQAAAWLSISERYLSQLTREGRIRAVRFGIKAVRYALSDLTEFAASCRI